MLDGDRQITSSDRFPPEIPENDQTKGIFNLPFWELENIFLIPELTNKVITEKDGKLGNDLIWEKINEKKEDLFKRLVSTTVKNIVLRRFRYENFPIGTLEELENWKSKASEISINQEELQKKFDEVITSKNWQWVPGKEVLGLIIVIEENFWDEIRKLVDSGEFASILDSNTDIKALKQEVNKND